MRRSIDANELISYLRTLDVRDMRFDIRSPRDMGPPPNRGLGAPYHWRYKGPGCPITLVICGLAWGGAHITSDLCPGSQISRGPHITLTSEIFVVGRRSVQAF